MTSISNCDAYSFCVHLFMQECIQPTMCRQTVAVVYLKASANAEGKLGEPPCYYFFLRSAGLKDSINSRCSGVNSHDSGILTLSRFSGCGLGWAGRERLEMNIISPNTSRQAVQQPPKTAQSPGTPPSRLFASRADRAVGLWFLTASTTSYNRYYLSFWHQTIGTINHHWDKS